MASHVGNVTPASPQAHAIARKTESLIRSKVSQLSASTLAAALDAAPSTVGRWLSGECCIPLQRLGPFLDAMGLEIVPREELDALRLFAGRHLLGGDA